MQKRISLLKQKMEINWWLWMFLSLPFGIYLFLLPYDHGDWIVSDCGFLVDWIKHYQIGSEFWRDFGSAILCDFGPPIGLGFITQALILFVWRNRQIALGKVKPHANDWRGDEKI